MGRWPEYEIERLAGALLRVDLYEQRYLAVGEYHNVVNHLLRSAAAACLSDQEDDAVRFILRAAFRMEEWVGAVREGKSRRESFADFACTRGWLAAAIGGGSGAAGAARSFLELTGEAPSGPTQNARMVAAALVGDMAAVETAARGCELSDAGLGLPLRKFMLAMVAEDEPAMTRAAITWLQEKMEATMTHEWGAYNEVPIEVSGALALAARRHIRMTLDSNRVLNRYRD
jgi:hypothetical protein